MESAAELAVHRANTLHFINADVKTIILLRSTRTPNGQGGYITSTPVPRPAQQFRLIPLHGNRSPERTSLEGFTVQPEFMLLGTFDADMERWDSFVDQGMRYQIVWVHEKRSYETKGEVIYLGAA